MIKKESFSTATRDPRDITGTRASSAKSLPSRRAEKERNTEDTAMDTVTEDMDTGTDMEDTESDTDMAATASTIMEVTEVTATKIPFSIASPNTFNTMITFKLATFLMMFQSLMSMARWKSMTKTTMSTVMITS